MKVSEEKTQISDVKFNLCDSKPRPEIIRLTLASWGIPVSCSANGRYKYCYNATKVLKLSAISQKMLSLFALKANVKLRIIITHDSGTSCFQSMDIITKIE